MKAIDDPSAGSLSQPAYLDKLGRPPSPQHNEASNIVKCVGDEMVRSHPSMSNERNKREKIYEKNILQHQLPYPLHQTNHQLLGSQDQATGQTLSNVHNGIGKVMHGNVEFSSAEVQSVLQAPGLTPPLYASAAAYMASGNQFYSNTNPTALYAPQYNMGGYAIGSTFFPPYVAGYTSHSGLPMHIGSGQSFSGQTAAVSTGESGRLLGDMQAFNKFYSNQGLVVHPFQDPLQIHYFQQPLEDAYGHPAQYGRLQPMSIVGGQFDSYASQKDPNLPSYIADKKFQSTPSGSQSVFSPRRVETASNSYYGSAAGIGFVPQFPVSPLGSPVLPGSPIGGAPLSGRRNDHRFSQASVRSAGVYSSWQGQRGSDGFNDPKKHSFLEELRASNARKIDLSDITGRIVEFRYCS